MFFLQKFSLKSSIAEDSNFSNEKVCLLLYTTIQVSIDTFIKMNN